MRRPLRSSAPTFTRLLPALVLPIALLAACGSDANESDSSTTVAAASATSAATGDAETSTTAAPTTTASTTTASTTTASTSPDKPTVEIPETLPTELIITDLVEGTGDPAEDGDTVVVNYVGVRSEDGTEFDNSYDRGSTFPVTLGAGGVIAGWEQGLLGIKEGGRRQLDIPAELGYGDTGSGDIIKPGDALSFVIDAVSVTPGAPKADVADKPSVDIEPSVGATESSFEDLVVGTGDEAVAGSTAYVQLIVYNGATAEELQSSWEVGRAVGLPLDEQTLEGVVNGITGMKVGGRRQLTIIPADAFGADGETGLGLPANTDMIMIVDLVMVQPAG